VKFTFLPPCEDHREEVLALDIETRIVHSLYDLLAIVNTPDFLRLVQQFPHLCIGGDK
jgi:hypothetical protein